MTDCPICKQPNQCAMEIEKATSIKEPCWCFQVEFLKELLA
ncbi:MAG: hypothetical protein EBQ84_00155 [Betaproteobacteria bacterium]|nr:hypothetical protein [Betaproteobacteria bacterium]